MTRKRDRTQPPAGAILVMVLVVLLIVVLFATGMTQLLVISRRHSRLAEQQQQRQWLADSAVHRAIDALARDADYPGETWEIPAGLLGAGQTGRTVIRIETVSAPTTGRLVRVQTQYPALAEHQSLLESERFISLPKPGEKP